MLTQTFILIGVCLIALLTIGIVLARLYRRASKEISFVRTGLGGQMVVMDGGAVVLPIFHDVIPVNMNTLKLEVHRGEGASLITKDRLRVDIVAAFFVRVMPNREAIANAAQTLGRKTLDPMALKELVEDKFVDSLRATAATMTMQQLQDARHDFVQGVQNAVSEDLLKNGLELESVSLTSLDQTGKDFFNPQNAFDAEGLTRLTQETERRRKERNDIEQDTEMAVREKNLSAEQQKLEIERQQEFIRLDQQQAVSKQRAEQAALVAAIEAEKSRESEQAKIAAKQQIDQSRIGAERQVRESEVERDQLIKQREIEAQQQVEVARINQQKVMAIADQDKSISVARKSEEQSQVEARANQARAEAVKSEEAVITARETAVAEREKAITLVKASREAEQQAIGVKVAAEAQKQAADDQAEAVKIKASADRIAFEVEALGKRLINEAINTLSPEQIAMQVRLALIGALPEIIEKSVEPIKGIDSIKILQVDGLTRTMGGDPVSGGGNLAEQAVNAALNYRVQQPLIDALLSELGVKGGSLEGLTRAARPKPDPEAPGTQQD
ncbi:MAG: flotillin domain-containing protein [Gammaproteobacteria bacterium]